MMLHFTKLLLLLLCLEAQAQRCATPTFANHEVAVFKVINFSYITIKIRVTGCITPEVIAKQLGPTKVSQLQCVNQSVPIIHERAVAHFPNIIVLTISHSNVREIKSNAFLDLPELSSLNLKGNKLTTIRKGVFTNLPLRNLDLSNNELSFIEHGGFDLPNMISLSLENNKLTAFEPEWLTSKILETAYLNGNNIHSIGKNTFKPFKNLSQIELATNRLQHIDKDAFSELEKLHTLYLYENRITKLERDLFQHNKAMSALWLHGNNITYISEKTLNDLPNLFQITIHTNPWQCACYHSIIKWANVKSTYIVIGVECFSDNNPTCVYPTENQDLCLEYRSEDLDAIFYELYDFNYGCS